MADHAMREIHSEAGEQRYALTPDLFVHRTLNETWVRSPVAQKFLRLSKADWAFLQEFSSGQTPRALPLGGAKYGTALEIFLGVEKFLRLGILAEERILPSTEIARLIALPEDTADVLSPVAQRGVPVSTLPYASLEAEYTALPVWERADNALVLLKGAAIARAALEVGRQLRVLLLPPESALMVMTSLPQEFFGSQRLGVPYHSILKAGREYLAGRRPDLYQRFALMEPSDINRKSVLDLGCNIGVTAYLAAEHGARDVLGLDLAPLVQAARRLNLFYDAPCRFVAHDLNRPRNDLGRFDTAFVFAVLGHLETASGVTEILRETGVKTVYVETHCKVQDQGETQAFLDSELFAHVDYLGDSADNRYRSESTRRFFRCQTRL